MKPTLRAISLAMISAFLPTSALAQGPPPRNASAVPPSRSTPGRLAKFLDVKKNIGDSNITEDSAGKVGVGTTAPTSPLTVRGVIETSGEYGGIKFPDGTVQTSAEIRHDPTLTGTGAGDSVLGVAVPLYLSGYTPYGQSLVNVQGSFQADGIAATGGAAGNGAVIRGGSSGGHSIISKGGFSQTVGGGYGLIAGGGDSESGVGGYGVSATGGASVTGLGGWGLDARGGTVTSCCNGVHSGAGTGGIGVRAIGGDSFGLGKRGGLGLDVYPGHGAGGAAIGIAARFNGDVQVLGTLSKAGGSFKIDHPLDPENKTLSHSFVESPDMKNIYDGVASLDANGEAVVEMPEWFGALNRDYRYLLTALGGPMPGLHVSEEIANNRFKISGGTAGMRVSWLVTGVRQDAWANRNRIPVEEAKPEAERGFYLHPEAFDQPEERGVNWANDPETMRRDRELRLEAQKAIRPQE